MIRDVIRNEIIASIAVKQSLIGDEGLLSQVEMLAANCVHSLKNGGKIIFAGNGGSFADAQHLSAEFVSRFMFDRDPLASIVLGANHSTITAIGNDYGYEQVFARELQGVARSVDIFIPISTSGNSPNVLAAVARAIDLGVAVTGLTGLDGGKLAALCGCIRVPSAETARIQECHIMLGHLICGLVEQAVFPGRTR